ncbi:MAG: tetratricopeptide repeat protein [Candidatus Omnitrophota bacterium]
MPKPKIRNKFKYRIINFKIKVLSLRFCLLLLFCHLGFAACHSLLFAQEDNKATLTKQLMEAKTNENLPFVFENLAGLYFGENKYNEFVEFLKNLVKQKPALESMANCYVAFTRYHQLKYLEAKQSWDEYFSQGSVYQGEIIQCLSQKTLENLSPADSFLGVYARLILWKLHKDENDSSTETALSDLIAATLIYAKESHYLGPIKTVADDLLLYGEKVHADQIYRVYLDKRLASNINSGELKKIGLDFYKQGNILLAESVFDIYFEKIQNDEKDKDKVTADLIEIAKVFSYNDTDVYDLMYAEKIFKRIEDSGGKIIFDQDLPSEQNIWSEDLLYSRAFNLEKARQYRLAKDFYNELIKRYPSSRYADEAAFKIGIIYAYILKDINSGKNYFEKLTNPILLEDNSELVDKSPQNQISTSLNPSGKTEQKNQNASPQVISGLYQLGLIAQWEEDFAKAKNYYTKLIAAAKDEYKEIPVLAEERLREIEEAKPMGYNLKRFLDICFKTDAFSSNWEKVNLKSAPCRVKKDSEVNISSACQVAETGCFNVELEYLWSADTGITKPVNQQASFATQYTEPGTKIVHLLVVSSTGIIGCDLNFIDVTID